MDAVEGSSSSVWAQTLVQGRHTPMEPLRNDWTQAAGAAYWFGWKILKLRDLIWMQRSRTCSKMRVEVKPTQQHPCRTRWMGAITCM
jgi:hypothetical protein